MKNFGSFRWRRGENYLKKGEKPIVGDSICLDYRISGSRKRPVFETLKTGSKSEIANLEREARNYLDQLEKDLKNSAALIEKPDYPTYTQMAEWWWENDYCQRTYMMDRSRQISDRGKLDYAIEFFRGKTGDQIDREQVKKFRMYLRKVGASKKKPWKDSYINRIISMVGQVYRGCIVQEIYDSKTSDLKEVKKYGKIELCVRLNNPIHGLPKLYEVPVEPVVPNVEQLVKFMSFLPPVLKYCALIGVHTGLRKRNILQLRVSEVRLSTGEFVIGSTKGVLPMIIKLHPELIKLFSRLSQFWREDQVFVFEKTPGKPFKKLDDSWNKARDLAGIPGFQFRNLRTTYATWRVEENISMPLLQAAMGHTTSQTTARYYNKARHATETILKTQRSVFCDRDQISDQAVATEG